MTCVFMILRLAVTVRGVGAYSRAPHTAHETALQKLTSAAWKVFTKSPTTWSV